MTARILISAEQDSINVFKHGKLISEAFIFKRKVDSSLIVTAPLTMKAETTFRISGLCVDISQLDLAQVHFRLVAPGEIQKKPTYAEVIVDDDSVILKNNIIRDTGGGLQKATIFYDENSLLVEMIDNEISGHPIEIKRQRIYSCNEES